MSQLFEEKVIKKDACSAAFPHNIVPQLQIVGLEGLVGFALEVFVKTILLCREEGMNAGQRNTMLAITLNKQ